MSESWTKWKEIREKAGPFPPEAYQFLRDGLAHTVSMIHGGQLTEEDNRHVSGQQLCIGLRDFAIRQYGLLARTVLAKWGLRSTEDFGRMVFALVDAGLMRKSDEDSLDDFSGVYEFAEAFGDPGTLN